MLEKIKKFLVTQDDRKLKEAESSFDELMKEVEKDELDLNKLERQVQDKFEGIQKDVKDIRQGVDDVIGNQSA